MGEVTAWALLFIFLSCLSGLLMIYCSISIGQLFNKYKILAAIITYVVIYILMQIISMLSMIKTSMDTLSNSALEYSSQNTVLQASGIDNGFIISSLIQTSIYAIIFYVITAYISSKKVNLD